MIDVENSIFTTVATVLRSSYSGIYVSGELNPSPSSFPAASLVEMDNSTYTRTIDNMVSENHAQLMYQAEVYSNLTAGKKAECKAIMATIDTEMQKLGFVRAGSGPVSLPNEDKAKYRMVSRYRAVVSKDNYVYHK